MATSVDEENRFCDICQCQVPGGGWASHVAGKAHCRRASSRKEAVLESSNRNRNGVSVSTQETGLDFGIVDPGKASEVVKYFVLKVTTETGEFMVLGPQWTSMSLSVGTNTPCVTLNLNQSRLNETFSFAASHVASKAIPTSGEVAMFGSSYACTSPRSADMKICWRSDLLVSQTINSFP